MNLPEKIERSRQYYRGRINSLRLDISGLETKLDQCRKDRDLAVKSRDDYLELNDEISQRVNDLLDDLCKLIRMLPSDDQLGVSTAVQLQLVIRAARVFDDEFDPLAPEKQETTE